MLLFLKIIFVTLFISIYNINIRCFKRLNDTLLNMGNRMQGKTKSQGKTRYLSLNLFFSNAFGRVRPFCR